ncbi:MAG: hypothetical protein JO001_29520 [Alphaproteobacteria bacterium]|nr:hypothetical protein [Alphaproteobacteria bacterium]
MSDSAHRGDGEIIHTAYAEKVHEAFRIFADAISMGENEKTCKERFLRNLQVTRRARDLAIDAINGIDMVEPIAALSSEEKKRKYGEPEAVALPAELQAMVDASVSKTTGISNKPIQPLPPRR